VPLTTHLAAGVVAFLALAPSGSLAQQTRDSVPGPTGRVIGRIIEETTGAPIPGAQVGVAAGGTPVTSAIDGRYILLGVPAGRVAIAVRAIGYAPKTVSGLDVPAGGAVSMDITLTPHTVQVGEITVSAELERGSVSAALETQRNSTNVINAVTAEQIARTPDSDAAQAVQRVSGVTVQDGRYVFVRGLGERYTTTSLNGSRLPSPEAERKVVPLDLFPSSLLDGITTTKTYTPDEPGDYSGARVDLRTREFPLRRTITLSMSTGYNSAATGRSLAMAPTLGREWLGEAGSARSLPAPAAGDLSNLTLPEAQAIIGSLRNSWSPRFGDGSPSGGFSLALGGEDPVLGQPIGYVGSFSYSYGTEVRSGEERAVAAAAGTSTVPINAYRGSTATQSVLWGGLVNLTVRLGATSKLAFNNTFSRSADNASTVVRGVNEEFSRDFEITRLGFVSRSVRSNQLAGQHLLWGRHFVDWSVTSAGVWRYEPDRSDLIYDLTGTAPQWFGGTRSAIRTFTKTEESSLDVAGSWRIEVGDLRRSAIKVGFSRRTATRDNDARAFLISNLNLSDAERTVPPESIFARPADLFLQPDVLVGPYHADDAVTAAYAMLDVPLGPRLRLVGGARAERWELELGSYFLQFNRDSIVSRRNTDLLPSLALTWQIHHNHNLRLSATQTLSRPEYREIALTTTRDIAGGVDQQGNDSLQRALVRNFDLRWEWYPRRGEVVSVALFGKTFTGPIERRLIQSGTTVTTSWFNADGADNYGVELEFQRQLDVIAPVLAPWALSFNATIMRSSVRVDTTKENTNADRAMVGQAPYVVNVGLSYGSAGGGFSATALYNVVGRRIYEAAVRGQPDAVEHPRHVVDLAVRAGLSSTMSMKLDLKNLLDEPYRITQGAVTRHRYTVGRTVAVGLNWQP
jgi:hypothetical protein